MDKMAESAHRENMLSAMRAGVKGSNRGYLQGLLAAGVAVAQVTGRLKVADMDDPTWRVVAEITETLLEMAVAEADRIERQ